MDPLPTTRKICKGASRHNLQTGSIRLRTHPPCRKTNSTRRNLHHFSMRRKQTASLLSCLKRRRSWCLEPRQALFHRQFRRTPEIATGVHVADNPHRLQFVLSLTCGEDFYKHPSSPTLGKRLRKAPVLRL